MPRCSRMLVADRLWSPTEAARRVDAPASPADTPSPVWSAMPQWTTPLELPCPADREDGEEVSRRRGVGRRRDPAAR